jgi:hypothetical protein
MSTVLVKPPPPPAPTAVHPGRRPTPRTGPEDNLTAARTFIGALLAYKVITIALILIWARGMPNLVPLVVAMNWIWIIPLVLFLSVIPFAFWLRLLRARRRRAALRRSEWMLD